MTHLWWRAITENDRFRPTYRGRRPIVRHAGRAPAENPCPNLLRRNGPPDPLGNVKAAAISDKFRETTGSFRSAPLTRLSGGAPSHQPTSFVRSDSCRSLARGVKQRLLSAAENDRLRHPLPGRPPTTRHADRAPAETPCRNRMRRNRLLDVLGRTGGDAPAANSRGTVRARGNVAHARRRRDVPSHGPTAFVRSDRSCGGSTPRMPVATASAIHENRAKNSDRAARPAAITAMTAYDPVDAASSGPIAGPKAPTTVIGAAKTPLIAP